MYIKGKTVEPYRSLYVWESDLAVPLLKEKGQKTKKRKQNELQTVIRDDKS